MNKLEGCITLNECNTVFARSGPLYVIGFSLGLPKYSKANGILIALQFFTGLTRWQTNRPRYWVVHNIRHLPT